MNSLWWARKLFAGVRMMEGLPPPDEVPYAYHSTRVGHTHGYGTFRVQFGGYFIPNA